MNLAYAADAAREGAVTLGATDIIANASPMVQLTLLILVTFSIFTWAIIFFKWGTIQRCYRNTESFLDTFWSGKSMDNIYSESKKFPGSAVAKIFQSGYVELQRLMEKERQKQGAAPAADVLRLVPPESSIGNLER